VCVCEFVYDNLGNWLSCCRAMSVVVVVLSLQQKVCLQYDNILIELKFRLLAKVFLWVSLRLGSVL